MMSNQEIGKRAQEIAHENSAACKNRPFCYQLGHGKACRKLAKAIELAMREAINE